jgi:preprotein translocase subunit YajC
MPPFLENLLFDLFIIFLFSIGIYSFLVMPRQRQFRKRQKLVRSLKTGTEVLTYGGLVGTIKDVNSDTGIVLVEVAKGIELRFIAASITQEFDAEAYAKSAQENMK